MFWLLLSLTVFALFFVYVKWKYSYWTRRGVVQTEVQFPFGSLKDTILKKVTLEQNLQVFYEQFKRDHKYFGIYMFLQPIWVPTDLNLMKRILQTDFQHFTDHFSYHHKSEVLTDHLFSLEGERWKTLRAKLTPTFTSGKMKMMFNTVHDLSKKLESSVVERHITRGKPMLIRETVACYSTDVIAACAFGLSTDCLSDPDTPFRKYGRKIFEKRPFRQLLELFVNWDLLAALGYKFFPGDSSEFFLNVVKDTVEYREKNNIKKNDFVHLLLQLKNKGKLVDDGDISNTSQGSIDYADVASSMFVFYLAGFETSSTTSSFLFFELACHQDVQDKLRQEIRDVLDKYDGKLCYDALQELHYTQMCIDETLRLYPPVTIHTRKCTKAYKVPDSDLVINKGDFVILPTYAIQRDPDLYPNGDEFNPENFSDEAKAGRISTAWMPFGDGPRQCIGMRFGYMQIKTSIVALLKNFRFTLHENTPSKMKFEVDNITLTPAKEIVLNVSRVE